MLPDLSRDYANGDFIPNADRFVPRWQDAAHALRHSLTNAGRLQEHRYGPDPRHALDLALPTDSARGLLVFIHGGYWLDFDKSSWTHLAAGALARGWAVALPSYRLAPHVRIGQITQDIVRAVATAAAQVNGPIAVTGHSAGGHLAARMACTDQNHAWTGRLLRVVPISPLADLRPLMQTAMNAQLQLDPDEAQRESPALQGKHPRVDATIWVGGQERPSFLWQARLLSETWDCPWHVAPGRHHFDVIDDLGDPASTLMAALCAD